MGRTWVVLMLFSLMSVPVYAQSVFVKGNSHSAILARADLAKDTHYKLSNDAGNSVLVVEQITWSQTLLSPVTTAVSMKLVSGNGRLLWSKTEPIGSSSEQSVVQDLLKDLAKAKPKVH
jgi:hypothetical protein